MTYSLPELLSRPASSLLSCPMMLVLQADIYRGVVARAQSVVDGGVAVNPADLHALIAEERAACKACGREILLLPKERASLEAMQQVLSDVQRHEASFGAEWAELRCVVATTAMLLAAVIKVGLTAGLAGLSAWMSQAQGRGRRCQAAAGGNRRRGAARCRQEGARRGQGPQGAGVPLGGGRGAAGAAEDRDWSEDLRRRVG